MSIKEIILLTMFASAGTWYLWMFFYRKPSQKTNCVDAIVPAYNEAPCIEDTLLSLLKNPYIHQVICVNDGSTDATPKILDSMAAKGKWKNRLKVIHQKNTGKGGALMKGVRNASTDLVFMTDADTLVPDDDSIGYLLAEIDAGADAAGGVCDVNLHCAGWLAHVHASFKVPITILQRAFQQLVGGAPFCISGGCGMYKREILLKTGFSDRTRVEDLDMSWSLVQNGYKVRLAPRCLVYTQECRYVRDDWKKYKRWIVGYVVCMRLYKRLLLTRFGLGAILPMVALPCIGAFSFAHAAGQNLHLWNTVPWMLPFEIMYSWTWLAVLMSVALMQAIWRRNFWMFPLAVLSVFHLLMTYAIWVIHGIPGFFTGREPERDKPTRYAQIVGKIKKYLRAPGSLYIEVHDLNSEGCIMLCMDSATKWLFALHVPDASQASMSLFFRRMCQSCAMKIRWITILDNENGEKLKSNPDVRNFCRILRVRCILGAQQRFPEISAALLKKIRPCALADVPLALQQHVHAWNHLQKNAVSPAVQMKKWHARHPHLFISKPEYRKAVAYA